MRYYFIQELPKHNLGTSKLAISRSNSGLVPTKDAFWDYPDVIDLDVYAEDGERKLYFRNYVQTDVYIALMEPSIKLVLQEFVLPEHRWYKAKAGYNLEFIEMMKRFFGIEYQINPNEKRDYWILQILNKRREELAFDQMEFNVVNFRDRKSVLRPFDAKINSMEEFNRLGKEIYLKTKRNDIIEDIDSPVYVYRKNYDILWGGTQIVFNEKVKAALEATRSSPRKTDWSLLNSPNTKLKC